MNSEELKAIEFRRQTPLEQLAVAGTAFLGNLHLHGVGYTANEHMELAVARIQKAYVAVNDKGHARSVKQLVNHLFGIQQVMEKAKRSPITTHLIYV
jgi:hypothetical protein